MTERFEQRVAEALQTLGYGVFDEFLDEPTRAGLERACREHLRAGDLRPGAVGQAASRRNLPALRGDHTLWLDADSTLAVESALLARIDTLRVGLNSRLWLNLDQCEAHYAAYPPGARYAAHRDAFRDDDRRVVSLVCYLNADWAVDDGGALRIHLDRAAASVLDVAPLGGRLVAFLSADFEHEVLPASRERLSIAGWMRRR